VYVVAAPRDVRRIRILLEETRHDGLDIAGPSEGFELTESLIDRFAHNLRNGDPPLAKPPGFAHAILIEANVDEPGTHAVKIAYLYSARRHTMQGRGYC